MEGVTVPTLSEALSQFITSKRRSKKVQEGYHQEVGRFVAWFGRDKKVGELSPSMVAEYAQVISQGGADSAQRVSPVKLFLTYLKEEGWVQVSLATHLRVPRNRRTSARRSDRASSDSLSQAGVTQLSQEGYDRLLADLESLKEERVKVVEDIKLAMADKDFRENAPLDAAKERQGFIESQIRDLGGQPCQGRSDRFVVSRAKAEGVGGGHDCAEGYGFGQEDGLYAGGRARG